MCNGGVSHTSLLSIIIKEYEGCDVDTSAMHILGFPKLEAPGVGYIPSAGDLWHLG